MYVLTWVVQQMVIIFPALAQNDNEQCNIFYNAYLVERFYAIADVHVLAVSFV